MKTSYYRRPKSFFGRGGGILLGVVGVVIFILVVLRFALPGTLAAIASPFWNFGASAAATLSLPQSASSLSQERDQLQAQVAELQNENLRLTSALADLGEVTEVEGISAGVMSRPPITPYDVLVLNKGSDDGVSMGALVYGPGGVPVGTITQVSPRVSRVVLYSASDRQTEGWIGEERVPITLIGQGGGMWKASVSSDVVVPENALVYVPGPGAISVGVVAKTETHAASPVVVVRVRPFVNPFTLTWVKVAPSAL